MRDINLTDVDHYTSLNTTNDQSADDTVADVLSTLQHGNNQAYSSMEALMNDAHVPASAEGSSKVEEEPTWVWLCMPGVSLAAV